MLKSLKIVSVCVPGCVKDIKNMFQNNFFMLLYFKQNSFFQICVSCTYVYSHIIFTQDTLHTLYIYVHTYINLRFKLIFIPCFK